MEKGHGGKVCRGNRGVENSRGLPGAVFKRDKRYSLKRAIDLAPFFIRKDHEPEVCRQMFRLALTPRPLCVPNIGNVGGAQLIPLEICERSVGQVISTVVLFLQSSL